MEQLGQPRSRYIWLRLILAIAAGLVWWLAYHAHAHAQQAQSPAVTPAKTIEIHANQFNFVPAAITLKKGETVKLVLISDDVPHGLAVEGLPIHAGMEKGHPIDLVLTPDTVGDFKGRCSKFCGSGHRDMHFIVHVVE